ncbi:hypothetical protein LC087_10820 [Bacillus carboniphilus]|uniref:Uncharacterized protein n=1 Tax=Bacillus carboniphilus TaxID=86663 RepID=A0ABY9JSL2_9BACI|nr:hypothetical protein [Bacillus carboniphilus]WLR41400.1 hypothetical protein LC087_10820 [Bacillus carboniphilus]
MDEYKEKFKKSLLTTLLIYAILMIVLFTILLLVLIIWLIPPEQLLSELDGLLIMGGFVYSTCLIALLIRHYLKRKWAREEQ